MGEELIPQTKSFSRQVESQSFSRVMMTMMAVLVMAAAVVNVKAANESSTLTFKKVTSTLPSEMLTLCTVATLTLDGLRGRPKQYCARECARNDTCRLFCFIDGQCLLSSGFVTSRYVASPPPTGVVLFTFNACYSAVAVRNDVTDSILSYTSSTPKQSVLSSDKATLGFYCFKTNHFAFVSEDSASQFWQANFGSPKPFTEIRILTRSRNLDRLHFQGVTVRVGDNPVAANNPVVLSGPAVSPITKTLYVIHFPKGFTATYITILGDVVTGAEITVGQVQLINDP